MRRGLVIADGVAEGPVSAGVVGAAAGGLVSAGLVGTVIGDLVSEGPVRGVASVGTEGNPEGDLASVGSALDNAVIESWHSTVEFELRELEHFATRAQARSRLAEWIEEYNHERRHSALGMVSPINDELTRGADTGKAAA